MKNDEVESSTRKTISQQLLVIIGMVGAALSLFLFPIAQLTVAACLIIGLIQFKSLGVGDIKNLWTLGVLLAISLSPLLFVSTSVH